MDAFRLSKWYLDCVADDGSALIEYWARLSWHALALEYAALLVAPAGAVPRQFHTLHSPLPPALAGSECTWRCEPLHVEGRWESAAAPVQTDPLCGGVLPGGAADQGDRWPAPLPMAGADWVCGRHPLHHGESVPAAGATHLRRPMADRHLTADRYCRLVHHGRRFPPIQPPFLTPGPCG
jgi:hypothetical protein